MRFGAIAALASALLLGSSADPNWCAMPKCSPTGLAACLALAADAVPIEMRPRPFIGDPAYAEAVHYIELANKLTGDIDALRDRHTYVRTLALDNALAWLRRNARSSFDFLDLGWLYVWVGDSVDASSMFLEAARHRPAVYRIGRSPVDGLLKLGLIDDALIAARLMQDGIIQYQVVARGRPASLGSVALALFSAGRKSEAASVLAEAYWFADRLLPGRTVFGFGAEVDAAKFEAYAALVPIQIALGDWDGAVLRARATQAFRLAKFEDELKRVEILHRTGATTEALRHLVRFLPVYSGPPIHPGKFEVSETPEIAAAFALVGTLDGAMAIMADQDEELRNRFGVIILRQRKDCARSAGDAISLASKLRLASDSRLLVEAAAVCAQAGDEALASKLLESILNEKNGATGAVDYEDVAGWAFALRRTDLLDRTIFTVLRSDGTAMSVRAASLQRAAALASKYLDNPSQVVSRDVTSPRSQPGGI